MQRPPAYSNPSYQDLRQPKSSPEVTADIQALSLLQAQVEALQAQIGMITTSLQKDQQMSSPSRKMVMGGSEQKRRPRLEHGGEKFSSPKSCSQFNVGSQSPRVKSNAKQAESERYRSDPMDQSQKDLNSTFGK